MEERIIVRGEHKNSVILCIILPVVSIFFTVLFDLSVASGYRYRDPYGYAFGFSNGWNLILYPMIVLFIVIGIVMMVLYLKVQITVTDKRVYGMTFWGKRVDLPLDSISAVATSSLLSGVAVATSSGTIKFSMLKNANELHSEINKLLIERQNNKPVSTTVIEQQTHQSSADELKKYKELLDSGVITQEEFDAKKKKLLDL